MSTEPRLWGRLGWGHLLVAFPPQESGWLPQPGSVPRAQPGASVTAYLLPCVTSSCPSAGGGLLQSASGDPGRALVPPLPAQMPAQHGALPTSPPPGSVAFEKCAELLKLGTAGAALMCSISPSGFLGRFKGLKPTIILLSRGISDAESSWRAGQGWQRKGRLRSVVWARTKPPPSE